MLLPPRNSMDDDSYCIMPFPDSTFAAGVSTREADFLPAFTTVPRRYQAFRGKVRGPGVFKKVIKLDTFSIKFLYFFSNISSNVTDLRWPVP